MPLSLLLSLSWRNLQRHARRTSMLVLAVAIGVAALVLISALLRGWLMASVDDAVEGLTGHLRIHAPAWLDDPGARHGFVVDAQWRRALDGDPDVAQWTTRVRVPAVVMSERETRGAMLVGIDPAGERGLSFVEEFAPAVQLSGPAADGVVLGRAMAEELATGVGKRVVLMTQARDGSTVERGYRVVGVYDLDGEALERAYLFTGREALGRVLAMEGQVTELSVRLTREAARRLDSITARVADAHPDLAVRSWRELMPQVAAMVEVSDGMIWIWYLIMMSALGFGLVNTLLASVIERVRELGLLQALGMRPSGVLWQVVLESWLILVTGLLLGLVAGMAGVWSLADGIDLGRWAAGVEKMGIDRVLVPRMAPADLMQIGAVVLVLGLLGSLYPAHKAVAIDPLAALNRR